MSRAVLLSGTEEPHQQLRFAQVTAALIGILTSALFEVGNHALIPCRPDALQAVTINCFQRRAHPLAPRGKISRGLVHVDVFLGHVPAELGAAYGELCCMLQETSGGRQWMGTGSYALPPHITSRDTFSGNLAEVSVEHVRNTIVFEHVCEVWYPTAQWSKHVNRTTTQEL